MRIIREVKEMQMVSDELRRKGKRISFVPTMGYLHDAHLSLVGKAREDSHVVVVSIFVNPTQFGPGEDYEKYPRDDERDRKLLEREGVDILFHPDGAEIYPSGYETYVEVTGLSQGLCGDVRPGHFRGVATVVAKLFNIVKPHVAVLGEKDFQQLLVIRKMVDDLNFDLEILPGEIVREKDGIAMSSRNVYLSPLNRERARVLVRSLWKGRDLYDSGERSASRIRDTVRGVIENEEGVTPQYVEVRDAHTLEEMEEIHGPAVIAVAAVVGHARLIDNIILGR